MKALIPILAAILLMLCACNKKEVKLQENGSINLTVTTKFYNGKHYDGGVFSVYRNGNRHNLQDFTVATGLYNFHKTDSVLIDLNPDSFFDYELVIDGKRGYKTSSRANGEYYTLIVKMEQFFK